MDPGRIIFPSEQTYYPTMKKEADPPRVARGGRGETKKRRSSVLQNIIDGTEKRRCQIKSKVFRE